jgi:hypothetical protein
MIIYGNASTFLEVCIKRVSATSPRIFRLLTPALSSFGEERENYFVGRFPA